MPELSPLARDGDKLLVYLKDGQRRVSRAIALLSGLAGVPLWIGAYYLSRSHPRFDPSFAQSVGLIVIMFLLIGLAGWFGGRRRIEVDPRTRAVTFSDGRRVAFFDLSAVLLTSYVLVQRHRHGTTRSVCFKIHLVPTGADAGVTDKLRTLRAAMDEALTSGEPEQEEAQIRAASAELEHLRSRIEGSSELVVDLCDELAIRRAAEQLARNMDLLLLDFSGREGILRTPAELDTPLTRRLHAGAERPPDPGPVPEGLDAQTSPEELEVRWRSGIMLLVVYGLCVCLALSVAVTLASMVLSDKAMDLILEVLALVVLMALVLGIVVWTSRAKVLLRLNAEGVILKPGSGRRTTIPLGLLESVRISTTLNNKVVFLSDEVMIQCVCQTEAHARWVGAAATRLVASLAVREGGGPYR